MSAAGRCGPDPAREPLCAGAHPLGDAALVPLAGEYGSLVVALAPPEMDDSPLAGRSDEVLHQIIDQPAQGWAGLYAKASFLDVLERQGDRESAADVGWSLARDVMRIAGERL